MILAAAARRRKVRSFAIRMMRSLIYWNSKRILRRSSRSQLISQISFKIKEETHLCNRDLLILSEEHKLLIMILMDKTRII